MSEFGKELTTEEGARLIQLASESLEFYVTSGNRIDVPGDLPEALYRRLGAFVSLHTTEGALRGCIGRMIPDDPLAVTVSEMAVAAGTEDPRFEPVTVADLSSLVFEVSVLSEMIEVSPEEVVPGRHGLMIRRGYRSGVLLPQVASTYGWDRLTFLDRTCEKAGLQPGAWREELTQVFAFTAQVF